MPKAADTAISRGELPSVEQSLHGPLVTRSFASDVRLLKQQLTPQTGRCSRMRTAARHNAKACWPARWKSPARRHTRCSRPDVYAPSLVPRGLAPRLARPVGCGAALFDAAAVHAAGRGCAAAAAAAPPAAAAPAAAATPAAAAPAAACSTETRSI